MALLVTGSALLMFAARFWTPNRRILAASTAFSPRLMALAVTSFLGMG